MIANLPIEIFYMLIGVFAVIVGIGVITRQGIFVLFAGVFLLVIFIPVSSIQYDRIFVEGSGVVVKHYEVASRSGQDNIYSGNREIYTEQVVNSSSELLGDNVNCLQMHLKKTGSPPLGVPVVFGVWDSSANLKYSFGSFNVTSIGTTMTPYKVCSTSVYTLVNGDRIGVAYQGGDASNRLDIDIDGSNPFDGTNTNISYWTGASWNGVSGSDYQGVMSYEIAGTSGTWLDESVDIDYTVKAMMVLFCGLVIMFGFWSWRSDS